MNRWQQIWTIARLELRRAFFSRRALWVYLLALFPTVAFVGHALSVKWTQERWARGGVSASPAALEKLQIGMSPDEVIRIAGKPSTDRTWKNRRGPNEDSEIRENRRNMSYFDGKRRLTYDFRSDKLTRIGGGPLLNFEEDRRVYAGMFQFFYLRLAIFFGCLGIFINLFRGEMLDKSLHFWFLAPVSREVLLLGKYLAGLMAASAIFGGGAALSFVAMLAPHDSAAVGEFWASAGAGHLPLYILAAMLGCVGYGSVFLASGLLLKNPIIPAVAILMWESINGFLPEILQKLSILHYLQSICPVPAPMNPNVPALLRMILAPAAPSSAFTAIAGLLGVTALVLFVASRAVRRLEINYGTE